MGLWGAFALAGGFLSLVWRCTCSRYWLALRLLAPFITGMLLVCLYHGVAGKVERGISWTCGEGEVEQG